MKNNSDKLLIVTTATILLSLGAYVVHRIFQSNSPTEDAIKESKASSLPVFRHPEPSLVDLKHIERRLIDTPIDLKSADCSKSIPESNKVDVVVSKTPEVAVNKTPEITVSKTPDATISKTPEVVVSKTPDAAISKDDQKPSQTFFKKAQDDQKRSFEKEVLVPSLLCPITQEIMQDPVINTLGYTYERKAILDWFGKGHRTDPMTNLELPDMKLMPNYAMKSQIQEYLSAKFHCDIEDKTLTVKPKNRIEIENEMKAHAQVVSPLHTYAYATGFAALGKGHQADAKIILNSIRADLLLLTQCETSQLQSHVSALSQSICQEKIKLKKKKGYYRALEQLEHNVTTYCNDLINTRRSSLSASIVRAMG